MASSVREAARSLAHTPLFAGVSVLSVGIGVGLAMSAFAVAHAVFFAPPPYPDASRLVEIWQTERPGSHHRSDYLLPERMLQWVRTPLRRLEGVAGVGMVPAMALESDDVAVRVAVQPIVGDWFGTLGTPALLGRVLTPEDERPGAEPAAVVSWTLWTRHLGRSPDILGGTVRLGGAAFTVVGVMPRTFEAREAVWVSAASLPDDRQPVAYLGVARLKGGATQQEARTEIEARAAAQVAEDSLRWGNSGATAVLLTNARRGGSRATLWILAGVVAAVLLIGLSNLTTLFLVRAQERSVALAVRAALGASVWQLGRGLATEAFLVALIGSALGLLFAVWGKGLASALVFGSGAPPSLGISSVLAAMVLALFVTTVVGLEPLRQLGHLDVRELLQRRAAGAGSRRGERRSRNIILGVQIAVCVLLVALLGLFGSAYRTYVAINPGYDAERLVRAAPDWEAAGIDESAQWALARQVGERLRHDPAVGGVALWHLMMGAWPPRPEYEPLVEGAPENAPRLVWPNRVDPGFFQAIGIGLLRGRGVTDADGADSRRVVVVTEDGANAWWPGENPLGRRIKFGQDAPWMTVVGVVAPTGIVGGPGRGLTHRMMRQKRIMPRVFVPARQWATLPPGWRPNADCEECEGVSIAVRASNDTRSAKRALRTALTTISRCTRTTRDRSSLRDAWWQRAQCLAWR